MKLTKPTVADLEWQVTVIRGVAAEVFFRETELEAKAIASAITDEGCSAYVAKVTMHGQNLRKSKRAA